jgi:hypothetical protein
MLRVVAVPRQWRGVPVLFGDARRLRFVLGLEMCSRPGKLGSAAARHDRG